MFLFFQTLPQWVRTSILVVLTLLIAFFVGRCTAPQSTQDKGGVLTIETKVKTDTIRIPQYIHDTIFIAKPTPVVVYKTRKVPVIQPDDSPTLLARKYEGSKEIVNGVKVDYTAYTSGTLDTLTFSFTDTRPKVIVRDSIFVTKTLTKIKRPTGLYLGMQTSYQDKQFTNFGPTLDVVRPKFSFGVGYDLKQAAPQLRIGINLFRDKQE